jgi:hypothetical protein
VRSPQGGSNLLLLLVHFCTSNARCQAFNTCSSSAAHLLLSAALLSLLQRTFLPAVLMQRSSDISAAAACCTLLMCQQLFLRRAAYITAAGGDKHCSNRMLTPNPTINISPCNPAAAVPVCPPGSQLVKQPHAISHLMPPSPRRPRRFPLLCLLLQCQCVHQEASWSSNPTHSQETSATGASTARA